MLYASPHPHRQRPDPQLFLLLPPHSSAIRSCARSSAFSSLIRRKAATTCGGDGVRAGHRPLRRPGEQSSQGKVREAGGYRVPTLPPAMSTPGSRERAAGLALLLIFVSAGINISASAFGLVLCLSGILAGVGLIGVGVHMADDNLVPVVPAVFGGARALAAFLRRHLAVVGLVMASCAVTAVSGEVGQVSCFAMFALLLLGLSLINIGVIGE